MTQTWPQTAQFARAATIAQPVEPTPTSQPGVLLAAFRRGERLTVAEALSRYGVFALSQRCGELRRLGWPITSRIVHCGENGRKRIAQYRLPSAAELKAEEF